MGFLKQIGDYILYMLTKGFLAILRIIPFSVGEGWARVTAGLAYHLMPRRRNLAVQHLKIVFGQVKSDEEIRKILKEYYYNFLISLVELAHFIHWDKKEIQKRVKIDGIENYEKAKKRGKGIIGIGGHIGNFALMAHALSALIEPGYFVFKMGKNSRINGFILSRLCQFGNQPIPVGGAVKKIERILSRGEAVGLLVDQRGGRRELLTPVPFFGREFLFNKGPGLLATRTEAAVLPFYIFRRNGGSYLIEIGQEIPMVRTVDFERDVKENMCRMAKDIEKAVEKVPDHWLYWAWRGFHKDFTKEVS